MEQATAAAVLIVGPPDSPVECVAHDTGNGVKLPKTTVDITQTSLKSAAENLVKKCPAVKNWEFTSYSEEYSYTYGGATPVEKTVHAFLVVSTDRGRERSGYRWVSLDDVSSEFSYAEGVIYEMKRTMNTVGLDDLGVDVDELRGQSQMSPEARAKKVDQDTTLLDF